MKRDNLAEKEMWTVYAPISVRIALKILAAKGQKSMGDLLTEIIEREMGVSGR